MQKFDSSEHVHRRFNPLTGEWVLVSPHRAKRPWQGQVEEVAVEDRPAYDPECYLCPGNQRAGGVRNPAYETTFVFENDFAALRPEIARDGSPADPLFRSEPESGICHVICFSPRHDLTLPEMDLEDIVTVVELWADQYRELGSLPDINHVQIFENKGLMMGTSNPHPHGQIWAQRTVPQGPARESEHQRRYFERFGRSLLSDYLERELDLGQRIVCANEHFVALVPYWAVWPFETIIISRRHVTSLLDLDRNEQTGLAAILKALTIRYDNLFEVSFPYSAGFHQKPTDGNHHAAWHLHMHFYPPLLRSATVRKFMVGYEMLGMPQRDIPAELSAERLCASSVIHFKDRAQQAAGGRDFSEF